MQHAQRTIAKLDPFHSVAYCNHDALHLNWGEVSVHMPRQHFLALGQMLHQVHIGHPQHIQWQAGHIDQDRNGDFQLRLNGLILKMNAPELLQLVLLVEEALEELGQRALIPATDLPTEPAVVAARMWGSGRYRGSLN